MRKLIGLIVVLLPALFAAAPVLGQQSTGQTTQPAPPPVILPQLLERAGSASSAGDYSQAVVDYSLFILLNPTFSQGYINRAMSYEAMGDINQAIQDLTRALDYEVPSPQFRAAVYHTRATMHLNQNNLTAALDDLNASLEIFADSIDSLDLRAQLYLFTERYLAALSDIDRLVELEPDEPRHYMDRGLVQARLGNLEAALDNYDYAIEIAPENVQPYVARALFHSSLRNFNEALDDLSSAIDLSPNTGRLYLLRGEFNTIADRPVEAALDYFEWIKLNRTRQLVAPDALTSSQAFTIEMGPGWVYHFPFIGIAGQRVSAAAIGVSQPTPVDPLLVILDINGSPLVADDDSGGNLAALIRNYLIPEDGEYTLVVSQASGGAPEGNVAVQLELGNR